MRPLELGQAAKIATALGVRSIRGMIDPQLLRTPGRS
jgi:hypothetical protein